MATLEKLANGGAPPGNDTKLVNGVTPLANGKIGQRSGTVVETAIAQEQEQRGSRILRSTSQKRGDYLQKLLNCKSNKRIYKVLCMQKGTFQALCTWLRKDKGLKDS